MIVYRSFYESIKELPKANQAEVWEAVFELGFNFKEIELKGLSLTVFRLMSPIIKKNIAQFKNGKKPKDKPKQNAIQAEAKDEPSLSQLEAEAKPIKSQTEAYKDKEVDKDKDKEVDFLKEPQEVEPTEIEAPTMSPFARLKKYKTIWLSDIQATYVFVDAFKVGDTWEKWLATQSDEKANSTDLKHLCKSFVYFITNANNTAERLAKNRKYSPQEAAAINQEAKAMTKLNQPFD